MNDPIMPQNPQNEIPKNPEPKEKCLQIEFKDDNQEETQMLADFIQEGYDTNGFRDHNVSVKISLNEKMMSKLDGPALTRLISPIQMFQEGTCKSVEVLNQVKDKSKITHFSLTLKEKLKISSEVFGQSLLGVLKQNLLKEFEMHIMIENEEILRTINESLLSLSPTVETLELTINMVVTENVSKIKFLGENLNYLKNIKNFKIHLQDCQNQDQSGYFQSFFQNLCQMIDLESLEIVLEKVILDEATYAELFKNFLDEKLPKLKKLNLKFISISKLDESKSFSNFLAELHKTNLTSFKLDFCSIKGIPETYYNFFDNIQVNEKILFLGLGFNDFDLFAKDLVKIHGFLEKFPKIIKLELSVTQTAYDATYDDPFLTILAMENVKNLEYFRLLLYYNKIADESAKKIFKSLQSLKSLKYLFLDIQQSWQGSLYFNDTVYVNVIEMLENLPNLISILFNFDGNELKRAGGYPKIEEKVNALKESNKTIQNFKLLEKEEVLSDGKPNTKCHLPFEYFFKDFDAQYNLPHKDFYMTNAKLADLQFTLQECELGKDYNMKKIESGLNEIGAKSKFKNLNILIDQPIFNPSSDESILKRKELVQDLTRNTFKETKINFTYFLISSDECKFVTPPPLNINETYKDLDEIKLLQSKELVRIERFLNDMLQVNNTSASLIAKTPIFVELLCRNEDFLVNFSIKHFEKIMENFNPDDAKSKTLFLNQIFRSTLNVNMRSSMPAFILSRSDYCKYLTCESFAFLGYYSKKVSRIEINNNGLSDIQKEIHKQKIESLTTLRMEENQYFSTRSCKESLLELIDNKWKLIKLRPPDFFYDNDVFLFETKKLDRKMKSSKIIQNSINEFYSNIREAIKDFELASLDDFYGDFLLSLIANLPNLKDINVSNLNLGDKFSEGFNTLVAAEKKKRGEYRFINLEIINNIRITNVGMKFLYVSFQIMRNYFRNKGEENLPKLKMFAVFSAKKKKQNFFSPMKYFKSNKEKAEKLPQGKVNKKYKKIKVKKGTSNQLSLIKKSTNNPSTATQSSDKLVLDIETLLENNEEKKDNKKDTSERNKDHDSDYEEIEVTDDEETKKEAQKMQNLMEKEEEVKILKQEEEQKQLEEKVNLELSKKNLDETNETIILNEGLGSFLQYYLKGLSRPKRFFCYNCDSEVCKECHKLHHKFKECQPDFIICDLCREIHHKNLVDCKLQSHDQIICRGFRQILQEKKENLSSMRWFRIRRKKTENQCANRCENCIVFFFMFGVYLYYWALEKTKVCIFAIRHQLEKCFVGTSHPKSDEITEKNAKSRSCLECLNCFFGDPDVIEDEVKEFKFNKNVIDLNHLLGRKRLVLLYSLNFIIYYFLAGFLPIYFRGAKTVKWESHYIYGIYAGIVFCFESYLAFYIIRTVNAKGNKILKDFSLANYLLPLFLSQIKKYDFYTDVVFIITNLNQDRPHISIISGSFLALTTIMNLVMILSLLKTLWGFSLRSCLCFFFKKKEKVHVLSRSNSGVGGQSAHAIGGDTFSTFMTVKKVDNEASNQNINLFCKLSSLLELECIGNCLDKFSTKNAWYFPYFGGYYIPQQIISSLLKFCLEDIPGFIIQVFVLAYYDSTNQVASLLPIIITTCFSLLASITTVLTAKASILKPEELKLLENEKFVKAEEEKEKEKDETFLLDEKAKKVVMEEKGKDKDLEENKNLIIE